jgi:hypothetical protein
MRPVDYREPARLPDETGSSRRPGHSFDRGGRGRSGTACAECPLPRIDPNAGRRSNLTIPENILDRDAAFDANRASINTICRDSVQIQACAHLTSARMVARIEGNGSHGCSHWAPNLLVQAGCGRVVAGEHGADKVGRFPPAFFEDVAVARRSGRDREFPSPLAAAPTWFSIGDPAN